MRDKSKDKDTKQENNSSSDNSESYVTKKDLELLFSKFEEKLKEKYTLEPKKPEAESVPAEIFATELSPAESVVKYLKENKGRTYHEIAIILKRDERGIWGSYRRSLKKLKAPFEIAQPAVSIPLASLSDRQLSMLESVVLYLKEVVGKRGSEISRLLNKSPTTISTVYLRAKKKIRGGAKR